MWDSLLKHRWTKDILDNSSCLTEDQESTVIEKTAHDLGLEHGVSYWIPDKYLAHGMELYFLIHMCPPQLTEAAKLSAFFKSLVANHNLNTIVAATMHNIQPANNLIDFSAINMWYERLDKRYNLSLGSTILPLLTSDSLIQLEKLDPPYMKEIKNGIDETQFGNMSTLLGKK